MAFREHSALHFTDGPAPEGEYVFPLGVADVKRPGRDVVVTYGGVVREALAAAAALADEDVDVEVLDLRTRKPLDEAAILTSVRKTGRVVVAYEGAKTAAVGAEVAALIAEQAGEYLEAPVVRVAAPDVPYPHNAILMQEVMVHKDDVITGIRKANHG